MIKWWPSHFLEEEVAHHDVHDTYSKLLYINSSLIVQPLRWKNWVYPDYGWVQTTFKNNVNMDQFLSWKWSYKLCTRNDSIIFCIRSDLYWHLRRDWRKGVSATFKWRAVERDNTLESSWCMLRKKQAGLDQTLQYGSLFVQKRPNHFLCEYDSIIFA